MEITFSGGPTTDPLALDAALTEARSVRVLPHGFLVYDEGPAGLRTLRMGDEVLAEITDVTAVQDLRRALAVSELTGFICMCSGDQTLEFLDAVGEHLTAVRIDHPATISWTRWDGDAALRRPQALQDWLTANIPPGATPKLRRHRKKPRWSDQRRAR